MNRILRAVLTGGMVLALVGLTRAQDSKRSTDIVRYVPSGAKKEAEYRGTIEDESPSGLKIKVREGKDMVVKTVPAREITYIFYSGPDVDSLTYRRPFGRLELVPGQTNVKKRAALLQEAWDGFTKLQSSLTARPSARRYMQYKLAEVAVLQARDDPTKAETAIKMLTDFKQDGKHSWLILPALKTLARLQEEGGKTDDARRTYEELADLPDVPKELKQESDILVGRLLLRGTKYADAEKRLEKLNSSMSDADVQRPLVQAYLAESRIGQNKLDTVEKDLKTLIHASADNRVRGVAYNLLGDLYLKKGQGEDAFWSYLRVDALYNDDIEEHAKALYRLVTLFDKVKKDPIRGKECADKLQGKRFFGTTYQKLAKPGETKEK
jgi:hypothetical protein